MPVRFLLFRRTCRTWQKRWLTLLIWTSSLRRVLTGSTRLTSICGRKEPAVEGWLSLVLGWASREAISDEETPVISTFHRMASLALVSAFFFSSHGPAQSHASQS